jgi:hypothetical protein
MGYKPAATPEQIAADVELLKNAIASTGMSVRRFAHEELVRDDRTVRKWLEGETTLPAQVRDRCRRLVRNAKRRRGQGDDS